jgi:uncharacterized protein YbjT (DUF2867 family)
MNNGLKVILTGATGMVGEGVLHECLNRQEVEQVLIITRNPTGISHPKLKEIIHKDFFDLTPLHDELRWYNACFFCLGVTSLGKKEEEYTKFTYALTLNFAATLAGLNPEMTFCYISGAGTDSSEKGRVMWARVKGKTENDLMKLPFRQVYNFRPAGIQTTIPLRPTQTYYKTYKYISWLFPVLKFVAPNSVTPLKELALSMINCSLTGYSKQILEQRDIHLSAGR